MWRDDTDMKSDRTVTAGKFLKCRESSLRVLRSRFGMSLGRQGRLDYVNFGTYVSPHLSRCPKFTIAPYSSPVRGAHRILSDAWQKLWPLRLKCIRNTFTKFDRAAINAALI